MKCLINDDNEITAFVGDYEGAVGIDCDRMPEEGIHATGSPDNRVYLYKLVDGITTPTEAGLAWETNQYQRKRQAEYPSLLELTVALYDTDDKSAVEAKRAAVKAKYPKPS
jgi:hypothetical protein